MMLLPMDPRQRPELWGALREQLARDDVSLAVSQGTGNLAVRNIRLSSAEAEVLIARMEAEPVCRISASRGAAIGPHFAGVQEGQRIIIQDFIATSQKHATGLDMEAFKAEIETIVLELLYGRNAPEAVVVPVQIAGWELDGLDIRLCPEGLAFRKA